jgi:hypothetical protein
MNVDRAIVVNREQFNIEGDLISEAPFKYLTGTITRITTKETKRIELRDYGLTGLRAFRKTKKKGMREHREEDWLKDIVRAVFAETGSRHG